MTKTALITGIIQNTDYTCEICKKIFKSYNKNPRFCSRVCYNIFISIPQNNPFYNKSHSIESKIKQSNAKTGIKYSEQINKKKGLHGKKNNAYKNGYWMTRQKHINEYKENICIHNNLNCNGALEIHHIPSMTIENCLDWNGEVKTMCRKHHMDEHKDKKTGKFKQC